jgi:hypothetical protein
MIIYICGGNEISSLGFELKITDTSAAAAVAAAIPDTRATPRFTADSDRFGAPETQPELDSLDGAVD